MDRDPVLLEAKIDELGLAFHTNWAGDFDAQSPASGPEAVKDEKLKAAGESLAAVTPPTDVVPEKET